MRKFWVLAAIFVSAWGSVASVCADDELLGQYQLLAISAADDRAVLKTPDGSMLTVKTSDEIEALNIYVVQVLHDRVVFKETQGFGDSLWLFKSNNSVSRVQRISAQAPEELSNQPIVISSQNTD